ncbi:MAG: endonuclease/exonuclease/phosphatase family protein [Polyangiaceae bacterium]
MRRPLIRLTVRAVALAYPVLLAVFAVVLTFVGESWWVSSAALYLPRVAFAVPLLLLVALLVLTKNHEWLWTQAVAALVLLFPVMGLVVPLPNLPRPATADRPHVRVMAFNIDSAAAGVDALVDEIDHYSPDVLILVEIGAVEELTRALEARYRTVDWAGQFLTASRYALVSRVDPERVAFGGRQRSPRFLVETLDTPLGAMTFYVVHPISPRDDLPALAGAHGFRTLFSAGHLNATDGPGRVEANSGLREAQIRATMELASHDPGPFVVAGDTNLPGLSRVARQYFASLSDGFPSAGAGFGYTYPAKHPWMRIDRILASSQLEFTRFEVGSSKNSDHLCVVGDLTSRR